MSGTIEFPMNYQRYLELSREALAEEQFETACEQAEAAYNMEQTIEANALLVQCLQQLDQKGEALLVADEMKQDYLADEALFSVYLELLIANEFFIEAEKQLIRKEPTDWSLSELKKKVVLASEHFLVFQEKKQVERVAMVAGLAGKGALAQLASLKEVEGLPKSLYVETTKPLLMNPDISLVARQGILLTLTQLAAVPNVSFLDIAGVAQEVSLEKMKAYGLQEEMLRKRVLGELQAALADEAPELAAQLVNEINMQFQLLYPFAHHHIQDQELWVEQILSKYLGLGFTKDFEQEMVESQEKTLDLIQAELIKLMS
ncbi:hypothetical protein G7081_00240 [Vagococcus coleopterorum]|uniref:Hydrolase n=1 Tax=Vagococcus coleopterorum TaxID=2714946 RepID=A0A6G8AL19_9ENTE|nr:hypothetical protein [Vagococcus coleopterorum]QIL45623.1 hypothetical protein G7081_00240 [Vagococcus coleopterorum]